VVEAEEAEVTHVEDLHLCLERLHFMFLRVGDDEVVDVDANEQDKVPTAPLVHRCLMSALLEAHVLERSIQHGVPGVRSLPQTIEGLAEAVDLSFSSGDGEARRLLHVHLLLEVVIEEGGFDIHVEDVPAFLSRQR
jgi:hypothetical protein